jgi:hypothetical protein
MALILKLVQVALLPLRARSPASRTPTGCELTGRGAPGLWEYRLRAIGCAAVVTRLAHFCLIKRGAWVAAAARQIAGEPDSHRV